MSSPASSTVDAKIATIGQMEVKCQICSEPGHTALDCPHLEAAAAARAGSRTSNSASAQLINYGSIIINQDGHHRHSGPHQAYDPLASVSGGIKKHHHHHHHHVHDSKPVQNEEPHNVACSQDEPPQEVKQTEEQSLHAQSTA